MNEDLDIAETLTDEQQKIQERFAEDMCIFLSIALVCILVLVIYFYFTGAINET